MVIRNLRPGGERSDREKRSYYWAELPMERIQLTGDFEAYKIPRCSDDQLLGREEQP